MSEGFRLDDRLCVVTGGASGIGYGIAATLGAAGAVVAVADLPGEGLTRGVQALRDEGHDARPMPLDLADETDVTRACAALLGEAGAPWLLVNNAGVQDRQMLFEATTAEWDRTNAINARGPFLMIRELGRAMAAEGEGRIVNVASASVQTPGIGGLAAYLASKTALLGLGRQAAFELVEHGITVNAVLPGGVATPGARAARGPVPVGPASSRSPPLGMCEPHDIGAAVLFFASPSARFVTNQVIAVDAGFSLS